MKVRFLCVCVWLGYYGVGLKTCLCLSLFLDKWSYVFVVHHGVF